MIIKLHEIPIREVVKNYVDNAENGVVGYDGKLNIRPKYQREFIYGEKERNAVIDTINKGFPLNVMYWVKNEDGTFEVLDGQQRTVSFCQYVNNDFSQYLHNDKQHRTEHNKIQPYGQKHVAYPTPIRLQRFGDLQHKRLYEVPIQNDPEQKIANYQRYYLPEHAACQNFQPPAESKCRAEQKT